ncbi:hypothetical protein C4B91_19765 [Salmonella enterica subsp. enterica serovar Waycross]|nr:hypothetical protein [Salmonella enterica]EAM3847586.1 hypothetical protein [Salmonella enterica]EAP9092070.1 hypothetical protein [Salmonella enterica]ECS3900924.1 hypothetical protein [Salmonella enterica]ECS8254041.1 hypothetical protein [Salmonella enterica subsp. enterica serovar Waycross]
MFLSHGQDKVVRGRLNGWFQDILSLIPVSKIRLLKLKVYVNSSLIMPRQELIILHVQGMYIQCLMMEDI